MGNCLGCLKRSQQQQQPRELAVRTEAQRVSIESGVPSSDWEEISTPQPTAENGVPVEDVVDTANVIGVAETGTGEVGGHINRPGMTEVVGGENGDGNGGGVDSSGEGGVDTAGHTGGDTGVHAGSGELG